MPQLLKGMLSVGDDHTNCGADVTPPRLKSDIGAPVVQMQEPEQSTAKNKRATHQHYLPLDQKVQNPFCRSCFDSGINVDTVFLYRYG